MAALTSGTGHRIVNDGLAFCMDWTHLTLTYLFPKIFTVALPNSHLVKFRVRLAFFNLSNIFFRVFRCWDQVPM